MISGDGMKKRRSRMPLVAINLLLVLTLVLMRVVDKRIGPLIYKAALAEAKIQLVKVINDAAADAFDGVRYSNIVTISRDSNGAVKSIAADAAAINRFKTELVSAYLNATDRTYKYSVKAGTLSGYTFLNHVGPSIPFYADLSQTPEIDGVSTFESVGINQTIHRIVMHIRVNVDFVFYTDTRQEDIHTEYVLAESVIVGEVPDSFTSVTVNSNNN